MRANAWRFGLGIAAVVATTLACAALSSASGGAGSSSILKDDFSDSSSGWGTGTDANSSVEYANSGLKMEVFKANFFTWSNPDQQTYQNVHMEVTASSPGSKELSFGLMCDQQVTDSAYYYFAVAADGQYVIGKAAVAKEDVFLTNNNNWAPSNLIPRDAASYRLGADCGNGTLALYVNGQKIDSVSDTTYAKGGVGLFLWSGDKPSGGVVYHDFIMTALK